MTSHENNFAPIWLLRLLLAAAVVAVFLLADARAECTDCGGGESWIFQPGRYTHDPATGARVAQYVRKPAIEPLPDTRLITSGYSRTRAVLRGADGSNNTYYRVQSYGNGRGGLDAEWERFHDAWRTSTIAGGQFSGQAFPFGFGGGFGFGGFPGYGFGGFPGYGFPGYGYGNPGYGGGGGHGQHPHNGHGGHGGYHGQQGGGH